MYEGKSHTLFARFAIPQMIGLLFNSIYLIVDGIFIGNVLGRQSMAAAAVAVPLVELLIALSIAIASGAGALISSQLAQHQKQRARQTLMTAICCAAILGVLVSVLGTVFLRPLARLLGATEQILTEAQTYIRYIVIFSPFLIFSFLLSGLARNDGRAKLAMVSLAFGSVCNIVLDYVFMCPMNMGIGGAALATAIGPVFSVLILLPHFLRRKGQLYFTAQKPQLRTAGRILILGAASFIMEFTIGIITYFYNLAIVENGFGEIGLAAYLVLGYLVLIFSRSFSAWQRACSPCSAI